MSKPAFLIIGTQKGGTTLLHKLLSQHPQVYTPARVKEIHFFDSFFEKGLDWYYSFFAKQSTNQISGEATPSYMFLDYAMGRIQKELPNVKLIISLREPVERLKSVYKMYRQERGKNYSFTNYLQEDQDGVGRGLYSEQLDRIFSLFERRQVLICIYEEFTKEPEGLINSLSDFLKIDREGFNEAVMYQKVNASRDVKLPRMYRVVMNLKRLMSRHGFYLFAHLAKKMNLKKFFVSTAPPKIEYDSQKIEELESLYKEDLKKVENILGKEIVAWK